MIPGQFDISTEDIIQARRDLASLHARLGSAIGRGAMDTAEEIAEEMADLSGSISAVSRSQYRQEM